MTTTIRDKFLELGKRRFKEVEIDGLGTVRIRNLNCGERDAIETQTVAENKDSPGAGNAKWKARFIAACVVNEQGAPEFDGNSLGIIQAIDAVVADQLYEEIVDHCESRVSDKELEKN